MRRGLPFQGVIALCAAVLLVGCMASVRRARVADRDPGEPLFAAYCAACHQYDGQGVGQAPPLEHAPWVVGPPDTLIKIVLHGVRGRIEIAGKVYDREMPGFGEILSDRETASLLTFVRRRFGGPGEPVTPAAVRGVRSAHAERTDYWRIEELPTAP